MECEANGFRRNCIVDSFITLEHHQEVIDQLSEIHDALKALEAKTSMTTAGLRTADTRAVDANHAMEASHELLRKAKTEVETIRSQYREAQSKMRNDAMTLSALQLDVRDYFRKPI
jgi:chromosome segregation ATPase